MSETTKYTIEQLEKALQSQPGECIARIRADGTILILTEENYQMLEAERDALKAKLEQVEEELRQMTLSNHFRAEDTLKLEAKLAASERQITDIVKEVQRIRSQGESSSDFGRGCMAACDDTLKYLEADPAQETP